jgi:hypothetical protein
MAEWQSKTKDEWEEYSSAHCFLGGTDRLVSWRSSSVPFVDVVEVDRNERSFRRLRPLGTALGMDIDRSKFSLLGYSKP